MHHGEIMQNKIGIAPTSSEGLLFLTDDQLRRGIEAMFFAYRAFTADPDLILSDMDYGRAHHRALHFINRDPGLTVTALLDVLGVTKQSLNRVLRMLITHLRDQGHPDLVPAPQRQMQLLLDGLEAQKDMHPEDLRRLRSLSSDHTDPADHSR